MRVLHLVSSVDPALGEVSEAIAAIGEAVVQ
jgi:hypothetical protein